MLKKSLFILIVSVCYSSVAAQPVLQANAVIDTVSSYLPFLTFSAPQGILKMNICAQNEEILNITFVQGGRTSGFFESDLFLFRFTEVELNLRNGAQKLIYSTTQENNAMPFLVGNIPFDASAIIMNENKLFLENAYHEMRVGVGPQQIFSATRLAGAVLSHNGLLVGGILESLLDPYDGRPAQQWFIPAIWNSSTGKTITFAEINEAKTRSEDMSKGFFSIPAVDLKFSPDDRFLISRFLNGAISGEMGSSKLEFIQIAEIVFNVETRQFLEGRRDTAFTSDGRFYVTERDEMPALISTASNRIIHYYDLGDFYDKSIFEKNPMTAVTFSPDNQLVYIARFDEKILVFPSHLPTSHVEGWEANK